MGQTTTIESAANRYVTLHRTVEVGTATESTWGQLASVCLELDKRDEALRAFAQVASPAVRRDLHQRLHRRGWVEQPPESGAAVVTVTDADLRPTGKERFVDAVQFLFDPNMRWPVMAGTVAFPIVLGLGGMVSSLDTTGVAHLVALLPVLFVVGMIGALGRHVLVQALQDADDGGNLPAPRALVREVPRFLGDFVALMGAFLAPGSIVVLLGAPLLALPLFLPALVLLPMAAALRFCGSDWRSLAPRRLLAAVRACPAYPAVAATVCALFAPALLAFYFTLGLPLFLVIAAAGPLTVAPFFVAMRMLGLTLHYEGGAVPQLAGRLAVGRRKRVAAR